MTVPGKAGKPSYEQSHTPEQIQAHKERYLELIREGKTLQQIEATKELPNIHILHRWERDEEYAQKLAQARADSAHAISDKFDTELEELWQEAKTEGASEQQIKMLTVKMKNAHWKASVRNKAMYGQNRIDGGSTSALIDKPEVVDELLGRMGKFFGEGGK